VDQAALRQMPRAITHKQAIAQRRAAEGVPRGRRKPRVVPKRLRLRVAPKDHGGVLRAMLAHET
jgi:hypothetical protein